MMKFTQDIRVYYGDTDAYGVVWHGSYIKWLEQARTEAFEKSLGMSLAELEAKKIQFPVTEMNIRCKSPAKLHEILEIQTSISSLKPFCVTFESSIANKNTKEIRVIAHITIAVINAETGRIFRRMPEDIYAGFLFALN